jgi:hypothetical protein
MRYQWTALFCLLALTAAANAQQTATLLPGKTYCSRVEAYARQHRADASLFSAMPQNQDPTRDHWRRVASASLLQDAARNANSTAMISVRDGHVVYADFTLQNQFGDSTQTTQYCFRPDGTLAQLHSELRSFHGGLRVVREIEFDSDGKQVSKTMQSFDLDTNRPAKVPSDFWDFPPPVFLRANDLPFAKDLP